MPSKFTEFPGTDEEVTCDNWREFQPGDHVWYVPEDAKNIDDVKFGIIPTHGWNENPANPDTLLVHFLHNNPARRLRKGRLSLAMPSKGDVDG